MATRSYRPGQSAPINDGSQILGEHAHKISVEQLIPRIAERSKKAVETVPTKIYFFQAIKAGRRCSCWDIEDSPDKQCNACFGTGIVGGFNKYGTLLEVVDVTRPNIMTTNVIPDWTTRRKPTPFAMIDGARFGTLETRIRLTTNIGVLDEIAAESITQLGSRIDLYVRAPSDRSWIPMTRDNIKQRLHNPYIDIRVEFYRESPNTESPLLKLIYLRYKTIENNIITANIPRAEKSIALQEFGVVDEWQRMRFWMPNWLKTITTEDFIVSAEGQAVWKIVSVTPFEPHGQLTSWDVDTRIAQVKEPYRRVPR